MAKREPPRYHKRIRLDANLYAKLGAICSVTVAVRGRRPLFSRPDLAAAAVSILRDHAHKTGVPVYGYCVMPDHVHLVIGPSPSCDIIAFVGQFKNLVQRAYWQCGWRGKLWQVSFWDHFLRIPEEVRPSVEYVLANPVRRGLVNEWRDYPFSGSLVFDL